MVIIFHSKGYQKNEVTSEIMWEYICFSKNPKDFYHLVHYQIGQEFVNINESEGNYKTRMLNAILRLY